MTWYGLGIRRQKDGITLDVLYTHILSTDDPNILPVKEDGFHPFNAEELKFIDNTFNPPSTQPSYANVDTGIFILNDTNQAVKNAEEGYFKLQLISQRKVKPHEVSLEGVFGKLENVAWTNIGPILLKDVEQLRLEKAFTDSPLTITHIDKFPYLVNYHIPSGVRITDGARVRLGAYLGEGTTVMPAGYINFNAGTEGNAMVEGRISAGVVVGKDSDIGGGASIMGTLSGGNEHVISIGAKCLLGANAGTGISLGFGCTIQAGLYITAGMKVQVQDENGNVTKVVKASELSGKDNLLFIQDSQTGQVICKPNKKTIALNKELHDHN